MCVPGDVVGQQRLLDEQRRDLREAAAALHGFAGCPFLVGVQHQFARADELAHRAAAVDILLGIWLADLELERGIALPQVVLDLRQQLLLA